MPHPVSRYPQCQSARPDERGNSGSFPHMFFILSVASFYIFQLITFALSLPRLLEIYRFYTYLLGVPDVLPSCP